MLYGPGRVPQPQVQTESLLDVVAVAAAAESCTFYVLKVEWVRSFKGSCLPFFQEIRRSHPEALAEVTITWGDVVSGRFSRSITSLSHRWMKPGDPECAAVPSRQSPRAPPHGSGCSTC